MSILSAANSPWMNILLPVCVLLFVVLMPIIDHRICLRLGMDLQHGIVNNPRGEKLFGLRKLVLYIVFFLYVAANFYLTFLSRSSGTNYSVHIAPLKDLSNAVKFDSGFGELFANLVSGDFEAALEQVHIVKFADIAQAMMNICFYIPMGYLLPYVFSFFRKNKRRPVLVCFLLSALTENLQLIFRRGCYDFDDLLFNTLGGLIGVLLYKEFAFFVTRPHWRRELKAYRLFRKHAAHTALFPFSHSLCCKRISVLANDEGAVYNFFVNQLGFRLRGQQISFDMAPDTMVLEMGEVQLEVQWTHKNEALPRQMVYLSAEKLDKIRRRLQSKGIDVSNYFSDPYTKHRAMYIDGPDHIRVMFTEIC